MKTHRFLLVVALAAAALLGRPEARGDDGIEGRPSIQDIQPDGKSIRVKVRVPAGVRKVTLESRARLGQGAWVPRAVQRLDGTGGDVTFRLERSDALEVLRVRGDASEPLPLSFYTGPREFSGPASAVRSFGPPGAWGGIALEDATAPGAQTGSTLAVVESDIWQLRGDTLYFFNQYRGLQVLDVRTPEAPVLRGTLPLAASGEQMYVVSDTAGADYAVLLVRNGCGLTGEDESQVLVVEPGAADGPRVLATVPLAGMIAESRLVGEVLYVAAQSYRRTVLPPKPGSEEPLEQWEAGTTITAVNLRQPGAPAVGDQLWVPGYGAVVHATDRFMFLITASPTDWWQSTVQIVDIAAADGTLRAAGQVRPAGRVADKFKLNLAGEVLTVISEVARWSPSGRQVSVLETFSLADPKLPARLGQLEVGHGEGLYATRFDGDRAYLVTFLRIDPLWVVDLRDPKQPKVSGELEVPGWSTYIHPLGDRLLTVGIDNSNSWRVAVSLFDVRDPAQPGLLARVPLGENSSWSEANQDEKALTVLADAGLVLVPYQGWGDGGQVSRVQLIDLAASTLTPRGVIEHALQPRRATARGDRIFSVSGREFLSVDAADRDHPKVTAALELSWPVEQVLPAGGHLLQVASGEATPEHPLRPVVRVARSDRPQEVVRRVELAEGLSVLAATVADGRLCVVQSEPWSYVSVPEGGTTVTDTNTTLRIATFALDTLPDLRPLGTTVVEVASLDAGAQFEPFTLRPGLVVFAGLGSSYRWWFGAPWGGGLTDAWMPGWWWPGNSEARLLALDLSDPAVPRLVSDVRVPTKDGWWNAGTAFVADGLLYLSHQANEFLEGVLMPGQTLPKPYEITLPDGTRQWVTPETGTWVTRHLLDVVDYADATSPTVRPPVNLPGRLIGLGQAGSLVYTSGPHWNEQWQSDGLEYVDACAYDGVAVAQVASLKLPAEWPRTAAVGDGVVFVTRPQPTPATGGLLETWRLEPSRTFAKVAETALPVAASQLAALDSLAVTAAGASVFLHQYDGAGRLLPAGSSKLSGCHWSDLTDAILEPGKAVWLPLGDFGLLGVPWAVKP